MKKIISKSTAETKKIGSGLALKILQLKINNSAVVLGLRGELGAGKTTFLQGFVKGLGVKEKVLSPTFILMRKFQIPHNKINIHSKISNLKFTSFYHFDCYRLENGKDLEDLGFREIISNPKNIIAIEWPEKIKNILPQKIISIKFKHLKENTREIKIDNF